MRRFVVVGVAALAIAACGGEETPKRPAAALLPVATFPKSLDPKCREGEARLYDECGSQMRHLQDAMTAAKASGKTVLVSLGAEWCIWCHVFDAYVSGETGSFRYQFDGRDVTLAERAGAKVLPDAKALNEFVAGAFVLVHIEFDHAPDTADVLEATGANEHSIEGLPFIFTLTSEGKIAGVFDDKGTEVRRDGMIDWYRGYDRKALIVELTRMRDAALAPAQ